MTGVSESRPSPHRPYEGPYIRRVTISGNRQGGTVSLVRRRFVASRDTGSVTIDAALVARMFDLGEVCSSPLLLPGNSPAGAWALHTITGRWIVKTLRPVEPWEFEAMQQAGTWNAPPFRQTS